VNLALVPLTIGASGLARSQVWTNTNPDLGRFLETLILMNVSLLIFNMLPVYPLDGGQILQALLWFIIGRAKSLLVVSVIGMIASAAAIGLAVLIADMWIGILAVFVALRSWAGFQQARFLARMADAPRHEDAACPRCGVHPFVGEFWECGQCGRHFDTFTHRGICPGCGNLHPEIRCPECGRVHPLGAWFRGASPVDRDEP
jgi:hypothetical protein